MMPKRLHLVQGSDEWLQWRRRVIGSSDAPVIMGETRWKDVDRLLLEKLGRVPEFQGNALTRRGLALEPTISTPPPPVTAPISSHRSSRDEKSAAENERARDYFVGAVIFGVLFTIGLTALVMLLQAVGSTP